MWGWSPAHPVRERTDQESTYWNILNTVKDDIDSRQDGRQREELGSQVGQVDQQEDEERLDDANLLGKASDEAENDSKDQTNQSPSDADNKEGGLRRKVGVGEGSGRREGGEEEEMRSWSGEGVSSV